jgi:hypothetical protein
VQNTKPWEGQGWSHESVIGQSRSTDGTGSGEPARIHFLFFSAALFSGPGCVGEWVPTVILRLRGKQPMRRDAMIEGKGGND